MTSLEAVLVAGNAGAITACVVLGWLSYLLHGQNAALKRHAGELDAHVSALKGHAAQLDARIVVLEQHPDRLQALRMVEDSNTMVRGLRVKLDEMRSIHMEYVREHEGNGSGPVRAAQGGT